MMKRLANWVAVTLLLVSFFGCTRLMGKEGTPEAKRAALVVINQYLTAVANGKTAALNDMIAWQEYMINKEESVTKTEIFSQIARSKKTWTLSSHPLMNLTPKEVDVRDDNAVIVLRKLNAPQNRLVQVEAKWIGGGWVVVNDNLFGKDGIYTAALTSATP